MSKPIIFSYINKNKIYENRKRHYINFPSKAQKEILKIHLRVLVHIYAKSHCAEILAQFTTCIHTYLHMHMYLATYSNYIITTITLLSQHEDAASIAVDAAVVWGGDVYTRRTYINCWIYWNILGNVYVTMPINQEILK